jgi:hypothetical protein
MLPEKFRRFIASTICALSAGMMLFASLIVCRALDSNVESMLGDRNKLPVVTLWFQQCIPKNGWVLLFGFLSLVIGYGCLAWIHRVSAFLTAFHALLGFFALAVWTSCLPLIQIMIGIKEPEPTVSMTATLLAQTSSIPWLVLCMVPLTMAAFSWRKRAQKAGAKDPA